MRKTAGETQPFQRGPDGRGDRAGRTDSTDARIPREDEILLHGHRVSYRTAGRGPLVVLIHGITGNSQQWDQVMPLLAERYSVVAPDLLGHGRSAKPRGDYSLGAYAVGIRDLLIAWDIGARQWWGIRWVAASRCSSPTSTRSSASAWCWSRAVGLAAASIPSSRPRPYPGPRWCSRSSPARR